MIDKIENARYLTDHQWLTLMELVDDNSVMELHMPSDQDKPAHLVFKGIEYLIHSDGSRTITTELRN